jgi:hypothetical protein
MRAVDKALNQAVDAVLRAADKEAIPQSIQNLATANGTVPDPQLKRARVIWRKLRLKQEFAMSYSEATSPIQNVTGNPFGIAGPDLPAKPYYTKALSGITPNAKAQGRTESIACLLIALQQSRSGVSLSLDSLKVNIGDTDQDGVKELIDGWGNPMAFFRFPAGPSSPYTPAANPPYVTNALDASKPFSAGAYKLTFRDPVDPEGQLVNPAWNNIKNFTLPGSRPVFWFEQLCHNIHAGNNQNQYIPVAYYMVPVIASRGANGKGLNDPPPPPPALQASYYGLGLNDLMVVNNGTVVQQPDMTVAGNATSAAEANDNLYSFRLRLGGRGD